MKRILVKEFPLPPCRGLPVSTLPLPAAATVPIAAVDGAPALVLILLLALFRLLLILLFLLVWIPLLQLLLLLLLLLLSLSLLLFTLWLRLLLQLLLLLLLLLLLWLLSSSFSSYILLERRSCRFGCPPQHLSQFSRTTGGLLLSFYSRLRWCWLSLCRRISCWTQLCQVTTKMFHPPQVMTLGILLNLGRINLPMIPNSLMAKPTFWWRIRIPRDPSPRRRPSNGPHLCTWAPHVR